MNLRDAAKGRECQVRSPVCNYDRQTTVLAHYRLIGISGMAHKAPDLLGAWACSSCHDLIDGRSRVSGIPRERVKLLHLEGILRTQAELIAEEAVKW